ncbi:hypothetical protein [uncultured Bacteroides sp.]|uniref:hypothetical protein n=1 Tax=uncultured Bacteroides sp. TaxID=162156 RepID=UPI0025D2BC80|nr:hypothetical protein [uncultured Bacteroides sp.]
MYKFYLQKGDFNEATSYYIDIISKALVEEGEQVERVDSLKQISPTDKVITIQSKAFFRVWLNNPKQYIINWYQGIVPEEAMCLFEDNMSKYARKYLWRFLEYFSLRKAKGNIFVSEAMLRHYRQIYGYDKSNYFVMPCFNQELDLGQFTEKKYAIPSFVYAGSLSRWQCIDRTLLLFKKIYALYPQATLTILTREKEKADSLCHKYGVKAEIKFVPSSELQQVLGSYKYGFIVRDDIAVNNVATPTKMNSYMAAGVIPVYSDVIDDFRTVFKDLEYVVAFVSEEEALTKIKRIETSGVDCGLIKSEYETVFSSYYSVDKYVQLLRDFLAI